MIVVLTALHLIVCVFLILVVLLQTGKGADMAAAFGGTSSQTAFGARGAATLLTKLTTVSAILFMITAFSLAFVSNRSSRSVVSDDAVEQSAPASLPGQPVERQPATGAPLEESVTSQPVEQGEDMLPSPEPDDETPPPSPQE